MQSIGIIGLGLMGKAISARLSGAGFALVGYDLDGAKREAFAASGHGAAASLADVVAQCDTLVLAVFDTAQVEAVTEGPHGIAAACAAQGKAVSVLCTSTCDPDRIESLAARCAGHAVDFIELPISGTSLQVARGEGVGLIAGEAAAVARARPVIEAICPKKPYPGRRRQRRPRQAGGQPGAGPEPRRAGRGHRLRRARRPGRGAVLRGGARVGGLFGGDGDQGRDHGRRASSTRRKAGSTKA